MPEELTRAFEYGIAFDASSVEGFGNEAHSDLFLRPNSDTLMALPWRPEHGKVVRMFSDIVYPTGKTYECDTRCLLKKAVEQANKSGVSFSFGAEQEFYLFELDENGKPSKTPYDEAGYMDIAPDDKGENIRREICLTLEEMNIRPESSHHEDNLGFTYDVLDAYIRTGVCTDEKTKALIDELHTKNEFKLKPIPGFLN